MKKRIKYMFSIILLIFLLSSFFFIYSCNFFSGLFSEPCEKNNTGILTVTNNTNDDIKVRIDGVSYGFLSRGETGKWELSAGVKYFVETLWPDGSPACSGAFVTVIQCQEKGIVCSAVH